MTWRFRFVAITVSKSKALAAFDKTPFFNQAWAELRFLEHPASYKRLFRHFQQLKYSDKKQKKKNAKT